MGSFDPEPTWSDWDKRVDQAAAKSRDLALRSEAIIARSRSLRSRVRNPFPSVVAKLTDERHITVMDRHHAEFHQREIERQIRQTEQSGTDETL